MITFQDLLTDPKYREMDYPELYNFCMTDEVSIKTMSEVFKKFGLENGSITKALFNHLQKLKAESETKANKAEIKALFEKKYEKPSVINNNIGFGLFISALNYQRLTLSRLRNTLIVRR